MEHLWYNTPNGGLPTKLCWLGGEISSVVSNVKSIFGLVWGRGKIHGKPPFGLPKVLIKKRTQFGGCRASAPCTTVGVTAFPLFHSAFGVRVTLTESPSPTSNHHRWLFSLLVFQLMANDVEDFSQFGISKEEKDKLVGEVIRYMLFKTHQNSGCPIKREELTQLITKNYHQRNLPTFVINEAKEKLSSIFGYEMRELQRALPSSKTQGRLSQQNVVEAKSYILISQLPPDVYEKYVVDVDSVHLSGFTFVMISIVYLAGGKIPEENLWSQMRRIGLGENEDNHPVLGNVKQALELLVQQRYLQKDKVNGPEGNIVYYELAERALDGPISNKVKEYISQIATDNGSVDAT
ncbi:hypothetical protein RJT34_29517 [Clitoria ternatea]|uniref:MAGE domain-containing protein n=1 Tax=Clitoria ternatea TaxID=43366 RepID=A0AAN9FCJ4_CLITE